MHINAFSVSWQVRPFYAFLPFAVIGKVLYTIALDIAIGIIVVPNWPTQPWYSHPTKSKPHPLFNILILLACILSVKNQEQQTFQQESMRIIQQSRRPSTTKRYDNYIGK